MQNGHIASQAGDGPTHHQPYKPAWMRAHVLVGQSYSLISVRCAIPAPGASYSGGQREPEEHDVVEFARYATALAQSLANHGNTPRRLEVEAIPHAHGRQTGAPWVEVHVAVEAPGLDEASLAWIATEVL